MQVLCRMCCRVAIIFITCQALRELFAFHLLVIKFFFFYSSKCLHSHDSKSANDSITEPVCRVIHTRKQLAQLSSFLFLCFHVSCNAVNKTVQATMTMHKEYVNNLSNTEQFTSLSLQMTFKIYHLSSRGTNSPQPEPKLQQCPTADNMG